MSSDISNLINFIKNQDKVGLDIKSTVKNVINNLIDDIGNSSYPQDNCDNDYQEDFQCDRFGNSCCHHDHCIPRCCCPCCRGSRGPKGPTGATGATGETGACACVEQMRNVLEQMITLFPGVNITVNYADGGSSSGRFDSIFPAPPTPSTGGVLFLENASGALTNGISICTIASVTLTGANSFFDAQGNLRVTLLPVPTPAPEGCEADCEAAIRATLTPFVGTPATVNIIAGGTATGSDTIEAIGFGVVFLGTDTLVSTCHIEDIRF